ncbi:hypothetical protein GTY41_44295 [Streptomyces sp. SID685]|nr:hypothetical protein [Streptomyces sp. SID685]
MSVPSLWRYRCTHGYLICELSHLSNRQYQRPCGEVVGLLVIAPSKTDREPCVAGGLLHRLFDLIAVGLDGFGACGDGRLRLFGGLATQGEWGRRAPEDTLSQAHSPVGFRWGHRTRLVARLEEQRHTPGVPVVRW